MNIANFTALVGLTILTVFILQLKAWEEDESENKYIIETGLEELPEFSVKQKLRHQDLAEFLPQWSKQLNAIHPNKYQRSLASIISAAKFPTNLLEWTTNQINREAETVGVMRKRYSKI